jgi:hypothetical protein
LEAHVAFVYLVGATGKDKGVCTTDPTENSYLESCLKQVQPSHDYVYRNVTSSPYNHNLCIITRHSPHCSPEDLLAARKHIAFSHHHVIAALLLTPHSKTLQLQISVGLMITKSIQSLNLLSKPCFQKEMDIKQHKAPGGSCTEK